MKYPEVKKTSMIQVRL